MPQKQTKQQKLTDAEIEAIFDDLLDSIHNEELLELMLEAEPDPIHN
jgi:hypothetical protein